MGGIKKSLREFPTLSYLSPFLECSCRICCVDPSMISCSQIIASPPLFLLFCLILMTTFYLPSFFHVNIGVHLLKASLKHCVVGDNLKLVLLPLPSEGRDYRYAPTHSVHYILRAEPGSHACLASTLLSPALHPLL